MSARLPKNRSRSGCVTPPSSPLRPPRCSVLIAVNAGYALARFRSRTNTLFGLLILLSQMLPASLLVIPFYVIYRQLGLYNSLAGIAMTDTVFVLPLSIWLMKGFFESIPTDLEYQAQVDGCTRMGAFYRITLPLATPGIVVVAVFAFIVGWDEFFFATDDKGEDGYDHDTGRREGQCNIGRTLIHVHPSTWA